MATTFLFRDLADNQALAFDPAADTLSFNIAGLDASTGTLRQGRGGLFMTYRDKTVQLLGVTLAEVSSSHFTFANGSKLAVGDDTPADVADPLSNTLSGTGRGDFLWGLAGNDTLNGGNGNDRLIGDRGNDTLSGGAGDDVLDGGSGSDTASYRGARDGVTVNLALSGPQAIGANQGSDTLIVIENVTGGNFADKLTGSAFTNRLSGAGGADSLFGGDGNDVLSGGFGTDQLFGGGDDDTLSGGGEADLLFGGAGNDVLAGGSGNDQLFGEAGDDRMVWNPGDGTDLMEGGSGVDTVQVNGEAASETFTVTANGTRARFDRLDPAPFALDLGTTEKLVLNANGGDDVVSATGNLAALIQLTLDGGAGNDRLLGSNGVDLLLGGDGNDFVDGQQGDDTAFLGAGDDVFQWDPGDGSDTVEGQDGADTLRFNGSAANEIIDLAANGGRVRFTRDIGSIVLDLDDIERVEHFAGGGTDLITVNELSGTDLARVSLDLAGVLGGTTGDGLADTVIVNGEGDAIEVIGNAGAVAVLGLATRVDIEHMDAIDALVVTASGGDDTLDATTLAAGIIKLTLDGGAGTDTLHGSGGADVLLGGDGHDVVDGNTGDDTAFLGAGDDVFQWDPGDGSDVVEGQDGNDSLSFNGSNASERIDIAANGARVRVFRDVANVTLDLNGLEQLRFTALGGPDTITVGDLSGTGVVGVSIDLAGTANGTTGDTASDVVAVNATNGDDAITVSGDANGLLVRGLPAQVGIAHADAASDRLLVNGLGGADVIDASTLSAGLIRLELNGGLGADVLIGSQGGDLIAGQDGDDLALMGAGDDTFVWNPGDDNDTLEGQAGVDTLLFNGANVSENIDIAANGGRVRFFRDIASVALDLNDVERIQHNALGGADTLNVNDLSGTDVTEVAISLAAAGGAGDAQPDRVNVMATNGSDVVTVVADGTAVQVLGLAAQVRVTGSEADIDTLTVFGLGGADTIDASDLPAGVIKLVLDGGDGDDVLIGSGGADVLIGGPGDDVLLGGPGLDILDGGPGDNVIINDFVAGAATEDRLDLRNRGFSFQSLLANAAEVGSDTVLNLGGQQITLVGVGASALHPDDFLF